MQSIRRKRGRTTTAIVLVASSAVLGWGGRVYAQSVEELRHLSLEQLADLEITSVSRRPEPVSEAAASVFVITSEDIRRSGAISLPEVLRLAPNLQVARQDALTYAISARGFNSFQAANKLLVLIDGRSIYSPLHAGVFWDQQQVMLEDIERIEVISGPGGTLWGANAVNGVINVITKSAAQTRGGLISPYIGTVDSGISARYGGELGDVGAWRVYALGFERGDTLTPDGDRAGDDWAGRQAGFRFDVDVNQDVLTLQGDIFDNPADADGSTSGGNLLGRWSRPLAEDATFEVQAYYDQVERDSPGVSDWARTFDIQAQHDFPWGERHQLVWGGGYRWIEDEFENTLNPFVLEHPRDTVQLGNVFAQDTIALREDLSLTLGTKVEYSSYTGLEYLPNARLAWRVSESALLWSAVSRAVRTPSRIDRELFAPGILSPASDFDSETLIAYEVGYRGQPTADTSLSISLYYHDYEDLRALAVSPDTGLLFFDNVMEGRIYGVEAWGDYQVSDWWRLSTGVNLLQKDLDLKPGGIEAALDQHEGNDPEYQFQVRSQMNLLADLELDLALRAVDNLPNPGVPSYVTADARVGWHISETLELSLAGFNLFGDHPETGPAATRREVPRSVLLGARWRF